MWLAIWVCFSVVSSGDSRFGVWNWQEVLRLGYYPAWLTHTICTCDQCPVAWESFLQSLCNRTWNCSYINTQYDQHICMYTHIGTRVSIYVLKRQGRLQLFVQRELCLYHCFEDIVPLLLSYLLFPLQVAVDTHWMLCVCMAHCLGCSIHGVWSRLNTFPLWAILYSLQCKLLCVLLVSSSLWKV